MHSWGEAFGASLAAVKASISGKFEARNQVLAERRAAKEQELLQQSLLSEPQVKADATNWPPTTASDGG